MKIGILTASRTDNNGTNLQALAMLNLFRRLGGKNVELINYVCEKIDCESRHSLTLHRIVFYPIILFNKIQHKSFRKKYFRKSHELYTDENINKIQYDAVVVGSDQIWNLDLTGGDLSFYLPFQSNIRKYSYAASFGIAKTEMWEKKYQIQKLLSDFNGVSVRELSGVEALNKIGIKGRCDLDPILMGDSNDWKSFTIPANKHNYILLYLVAYDPMAIEYAQSLGKQFGYEVIMLNPGLKSWKNVKRYFFVSVQKWLNLMANASMVITNSYHGLSFAILFKRNFRLCLLPENSANNKRMIDLLRIMDLEDFILTKDFDSCKPIDWENAYNNLNPYIRNSENYIKKILNDSI